MGKTKRIIAIALAIVLCLSLVPASALAQTKKQPYKIVAVGDSTAMGYGLDDFGAYKEYEYVGGEGNQYVNSVVYNRGFLDYCSSGGYAPLLAEYIADRHSEYDVEFVNLTISGVRAVEILELMDPGRRLDASAEYILRICEYELEPTLGLDKESMAELFKSEISDADLITLDCIMNSFTGYLVNRAGAVFGGDEYMREMYDDRLDDLFSELDPAAKDLISSAEDKIRATLEGLVPDQLITDAIYTVSYCLADLCVNFSRLVNRIRELNPTARILVGGAYSPFNGVSAKINGIELPIGDMLCSLMGLIDAYITTVAPQRNEYSFIDVPEDVETFREYLAGFDSIWDMPELFRKHFIDGLFWVDHTVLAVPLCNRARARAAELGLEIGQVYPADVVAALNDVHENGEAADTVNKLLAAEFEKCCDLFLTGLRVKTLDLDTALNNLSDNAEATVLSFMDTPLDELTDADLTRLFIAAVTGIRTGIPMHFSERGCYQKYEAAVKAYESGRRAPTQTAAVIAGIGHGAVRSVLKLLTAPLMDKLMAIDVFPIFGTMRAALTRLLRLL